MSLTKYTGSCLCGEVKYNIEAETQGFYLCHCQQCRKLTGSAMASNIQLKPSEISWVSGEDKVKRFDYPGERMFTKAFCTECGSALPYVNESGTALVIPAGSLDNDIEINPEVNIFWADKATWLEPGLNARKCEAFDD